MKKNSTGPQGSKQGGKTAKSCQGSITIGMDLGDKTSCYCVLDEGGEVVREERVATTKKAMGQVFGSMEGCRIALEVGILPGSAGC